jgi:hypothetical protein
VPNAGFCGQRPRDEVVSADDHGEFVCERDASAGGDEGLDLDGLVAVTDLVRLSVGYSTLRV